MAFGYYASVTVDADQVGGSSGSLTNYPILIKGTYDGTGGEPDLRHTGSGGNVENSNGYDISFYEETSASTQYYHELISYNSSTGEYIAWVRVPSLSKSSDTTFYIHYGDSGVSADPSSATTWSAYEKVWHMHEDPSDTAPQLYESVAQSNDGTSQGSMTSGDLVTGKIYNGIDFDGSNDYFAVSNGFQAIEGQTDWSVSLWWATADSTPAAGGDLLWSAHEISGCYIYHHTDNTLWINTGGQGYNITSGNPLTTDVFTMIHGVKNGTSGTAKIWTDGTIETMTRDGDITTGNTNTTTNDQLNIGTYWSGELGGGRPAFGVMEELRIAQTALDGDWILTDYNTSNSPATFYSVGSETAAGGGGNTTRYSLSMLGVG